MLRRLASGGRVDRSQPIQFEFNNKPYTGYVGDTLASALLANGVQLTARSWKYHRPRGILAAGVEEPNTLVQLYQGNRLIPNAKATEVVLVDGLKARSVNANPGVNFDWRAVNNVFARFLPAGFYYKTFMASQKAWHFFEPFIRAAGGLGESPMQPDPERYDKRYAYCDVLVVGGGGAGVMAALTAGRSGARVILADEQHEIGGWLLSCAETIDGVPASDWLARSLNELRGMANVQVFTNATVFGYHDHNFLTMSHRRADHLPDKEGIVFRERLYRIRSRQVVLATGAHERPLVFANNDLPGVMLAGAVATYVRRYGVRPGNKAVVFTNNDLAYDCAIALREAGVDVQVIDARAEVSGGLSARARGMGVMVATGFVVTEASGWRSVRQVTIQPVDNAGRLVRSAHTVDCDLLAISGGYSPVVHLFSQSGGRVQWNDQDLQFCPGSAVQPQVSAGACAGQMDLSDTLQSGLLAAQQVVVAAGFEPPEVKLPVIERCDPGNIRPLWLVPHRRRLTRAPKQFVDFQNDVSASDLALALREGFESIEHIKRYTAMGFGTDQGKTGNINGMGIIAQLTKRSVDEVGTTTFRPNYTPVSFGTIAGLELGDLFEPVRTTPMHNWHCEHKAAFEDVGQWKRPWYYPQGGEDIHAAVRREVRAARHAVAMLDASTLGKIDIQGPDASVLLNWIYCNNWSKLAIGKCRYGLMLDENGMVFDDGVTVHLGENHYLMHTTTGGAAKVLAWMERWLQTEWPHLKVYLTSVTDHWSTIAVAGPKSRDLMTSLCDDIAFDDESFEFMSYRKGTVAGIPARVMRISFSGERSYEINVPSQYGQKIWDAVYEAGQPLGITPYGTETMHVLRAEKGFVIVGQDTDGSVTPVDLGMERMVSQQKDFLGKRSLFREDTQRTDRKQLVGLLSSDPTFVIPEGCQIVGQAELRPPVRMQGHVTSSYFSPTIGRSIALAMLQSGHSRLNESVWVALADGATSKAVVTSPVFYDPDQARQNV
ncbi:MAG: sarcosine oxidase subunit alpha family protein [Burkholderiaceae bacterium]